MSAQVTISQLPTAGTITGSELVPIVQNGVTVQTTTGAISASPSQTQTFLTVNNEPTLPNSRYVGVTNGLVLTDSGAQGLFNISTTGALLSLNSSSTGFQVKTNGSTVVGRSVTSSGAGLSVTNGSGVAGDPVIALTGQVAGLANLSANGLLTLNTSGTLSSTSIAGTADQISIANATGVSGSPTVSLASNPIIPGTGAMTVPIGTTVQQPAGSNGKFRYNTTESAYEGYSAGAWRQFSLSGGVTQINTGTGLTGGPITGVGTISLTVPVTAIIGGTGQTSYAVGDLLYAGTTTTLSKLADVATGNALISGGVGVAPSYGKIGLSTHVTGTLPIANGGTGTTTPAIVAGTNITVSGSWPNQTINAALNGTVTSVGFTGGLITVANPTTTPAFTVAGTSGGITYFSSASTWASSAALTQYGVVYGGGAGATPVATAAGTTGQVLTATTAGAPTWANPATSGTVTSVSATVPTFMSVSGSPITSSGTLAFTLSGTALPVLNGGTGVTTSTGTTNVVLSDSPTLVTPALGTPSALVGTNITGTAAGLTAGNVTTNANLTGAVTSVGNAASLGSFTSLQLATALTDETGTGANVFATSPTLVTPALGTPSAIVLTSGTGLPLTTGVTGTLPIANGGTNSTATATAGGAIYGTGTAYAVTAAGTAGYVLTSAGASAPTWSGISGGTF